MDLFGPGNSSALPGVWGPSARPITDWRSASTEGSGVGCCWAGAGETERPEDITADNERAGAGEGEARGKETEGDCGVDVVDEGGKFKEAGSGTAGEPMELAKNVCPFGVVSPWDAKWFVAATLSWQLLLVYVPGSEVYRSFIKSPYFK